MICYICQKEITTGFYWAPCPKVGVYAAICKECHRKNLEEAKKIREEASKSKGADYDETMSMVHKKLKAIYPEEADDHQYRDHHEVLRVRSSHD